MILITESALRDKLGLTTPLEKLDRENIEKAINIFRAPVFGLVSEERKHEHA